MDIVFVISVFLITSALYRAIAKREFSFKDFYTRRILPAFFLMLFVGLLLARSTFEAADIASTNKDGFASAFFFANIHIAQGSGYFDLWSEERLFLHIWSLSIEEQYYFISPILLIGLMKVEYLRNRLFQVLTIIMLLLLLSAFLWTPANGGFDVYYLPHLRFVELLVGSLLAVLVESKSLRGGELSGSLGLDVISVIALLALLGCMYYGKYFVEPWFPGILSLLPCGATAVLLYVNSRDTWVSRVFSQPVLVWFGKISYSLYLWHWLVLAYFRYFLGPGQMGISLNIIAAVVILICSALSYYYVEQPLRHINWSFPRILLSLYIIPAGIVLLLTKGEGINNRLSTLFPGLYPNKELVSIKREKQEQDVVMPNSPSWAELRGDTTQRASVLVAGDSHTWHLTAFVDYIGKSERWAALHSSVSGTPFLLGYIASRSKQNKEAYARLDYLTSEYKKYDIVVLASAWGNPAYVPTDSDFLPALDNTIRVLLQEGKKVIVLNSMYHVAPVTRAANSPRVAKLLYAFKPPKSGMYNEYLSNAERVKQVVERYPQARWIDLAPLLPDDGIVEGQQIYRDATHFNDRGAIFLAKEFIQRGDTLVNKRTQ